MERERKVDATVRKKIRLYILNFKDVGHSLRKILEVMIIKRFWNWIKNEEGRTLYFDVYIVQDSWFDDDII